MNIRPLARRVRHSALLKNFDPLWNLLHQPYRWMIDPVGRGVPIRLGDKLSVRIPGCYVGPDWEGYEPETMSALLEWMRKNPRSAVLDIGCSTGLFSLASLFADHDCVVVGFDGDLASVAATRRLCIHAPNVARLSLVRGLVTERGSDAGLAEAIETTRRDIERTGATGDSGTTRYVMLDSPHSDSIPHYAIDELFRTSDLLAGRPILLKCDVEGAEMQVLRGASRLLSSRDVTVLLSVHPELLPLYDSSSERVRDFLDAHGYRATVIAIDHEEHWLCTKTKPAATAAA